MGSSKWLLPKPFISAGVQSYRPQNKGFEKHTTGKLSTAHPAKVVVGTAEEGDLTAGWTECKLAAPYNMGDRCNAVPRSKAAQSGVTLVRKDSVSTQVVESA